MHKIYCPSKQSGFSLIELMIAVTLGLVLVGLVLPVFITNVQTFNFSKGVARTQESARAALGEVARHIRTVGFTGCNSRDIAIVNLSGNAAYNLAPGLIGYERTADESIPLLDAGDVTLTSAADAITLKSLLGANVSVAAPIPIGAQQVSVNSGHTVVAGDVIFIGDCEDGAIVSVSNASATRLTLATALTNTRRFGSSVAIYKVEVVTYFLATSQLHTNNRNAAPSSLWRKINGEDAQELLVGIESLQLLYGLDTDGDGAANIFDTADALGSGTDHIAIVRFQAVTNSVDEMGGEGTISRPFTISVSLRNKVST